MEKAPNDRMIALLTYSFFDQAGSRMLCGGAERYLIELSILIREAFGLQVVIYQAADVDWHRDYEGIPVVGLACEGNIERLVTRFHEAAQDPQLVIYNNFHLASQASKAPSLVISHGVYWDQPSYQSPEGLNSAIPVLLEAVDHVSEVISVDTNVINWMRTVDSNRAEKFNYIPNFVDLEQFKPVPKKPDGITVLYPRRLYKPRGFYMFVEVMLRLLPQYPQLRAYFVGQAEIKEEAVLAELRLQFPERVRWDTFQPEDMALAYDNADVVVIPTLCSEGTSLSCLEAMAAEKLVITTDIGGLPNMIVDGYNGLLIKPQAAALEAVLTKVLDSPEAFRDLGQNARRVAQQSFSLSRWRERWLRVLSTYLGQSDAAATTPKTRSVARTGDPSPQTNAKDEMITTLLKYREKLETENATYQADLDRYYQSLTHLEKVYRDLDLAHQRMCEETKKVRQDVRHPLVLPGWAALKLVRKVTQALIK